MEGVTVEEVLLITSVGCGGAAEELWTFAPPIPMLQPEVTDWVLTLSVTATFAFAPTTSVFTCVTRGMKVTLPFCVGEADKATSATGLARDSV